jgi:hypothetical protein
VSAVGKAASVYRKSMQKRWQSKDCECVYMSKDGLSRIRCESKAYVGTINHGVSA